MLRETDAYEFFVKFVLKIYRAPVDGEYWPWKDEDEDRAVAAYQWEWKLYDPKKPDQTVEWMRRILPDPFEPDGMYVGPTRFGDSMVWSLRATDGWPLQIPAPADQCGYEGIDGLTCNGACSGYR